MNKIGTKSFESMVDRYSALHFLKRLAHLDSEGKPSLEVLAHPSQVYVLSVDNHLTAVCAAFAEGQSLIAQIEIPPPESWLSEMGMDRNKYRQQSLDLFTIVIHSVLDRALLLVNAVCNLDIPERDCSFKTINRATTRINLNIGKHLSTLRDAINPIADARHHFAHRGKHRDAGLFSIVSRAKIITQNFLTLNADIRFNDKEAVDELLRLVKSDMETISEPLISALDSLTECFVAALETIGGPDLPSDEELKKAQAVMKYFDGGVRPDFMR